MTEPQRRGNGAGCLLLVLLLAALWIAFGGAFYLLWAYVRDSLLPYLHP